CRTLPLLSMPLRSKQGSDKECRGQSGGNTAGTLFEPQIAIAYSNESSRPLKALISCRKSLPRVDYGSALTFRVGLDGDKSDKSCFRNVGASFQQSLYRELG